MNHCLGKKNMYILEKKEKANLVILTEKNQQIHNWLVKRKKPTVIAAKLQVQKSAQY